ncbi:MAG: carbamoyltransferase [Chitinophagaceae bacterium]
MPVNIIGISAFYHDSACCILQNGQLIAAAEEERFSRIKADPSVPKYAFRYCLNEARISMNDVDCVAYYESPRKKLARQLWSGILGSDPSLLKTYQPKMVENEIREKTGYQGPIVFVDHHMSHAASSFFCSGFSESAILTADGVGEWATTTYGTGIGNKIDLFEEVQFPDSLGLLYSTITSYLGFGVNDGEYKVMGLAPYGKALYTDKIYELISSPDKSGQFSLNMEYFGFLVSSCMYTREFISLMGRPPRHDDDPLDQFHMDLAKSMQVVLEEILVQKSFYLHEKTGMENLCMAGGVALNCVANGQVLRKGPFKKLYVQPAANDAGGAIGAAIMAHIELTGTRPLTQKLKHVYLGPSYSSNEVATLLESTGLNYLDLRDQSDELFRLTARRIAAGKVIGWFQGKMEFGPRSLGSRSILADPRNETMRDRINAMVKKREGFRPFAPAVRLSKAKEHFDLDHDSPFMLETCQVISGMNLPAITHVDGSARVQTVDDVTNKKFYSLLKAFDEFTGCPILLNTSFNVKGEPIVCTPEDALRCFITTDIDCLVINDFIIDRDSNGLDMLRYILSRDIPARSGITHDVYTFI